MTNKDTIAVLKALDAVDLLIDIIEDNRLLFTSKDMDDETIEEFQNVLKEFTIHSSLLLAEDDLIRL